MVEKGCKPLRKCEVIEEQDESEIQDTKTYCYNITSKVEVCKPKTCTIRRKYETQETIPDEEKKYKGGKLKLIPLEAPKETCVPWKGAFVVKDGVEITDVHDIHEPALHDPDNPALHDPENSALQSDDRHEKPPRDRDLGATEDDAVNVEKHAGSEKVISVSHSTESKEAVGESENEEGNSSKLNRNPALEDSEKTQRPRDNSVPSEVASSDNTGSYKEFLAPVEECECCHCSPCECAARGLLIENVIAALKTVQNRDELSKLLQVLSPEALATIDNILMKESRKAALWAAGGAVSSIMEVDDETFKKALREAWMRGEFDEMASCHCLPHMCPCPGAHRLYSSKKRKNKDSDEVKDGSKKKQKQKYKEKSGVELIINRKLSDTCICPPTKHYLTPATSGTESSDELTALTKKMYWRDMTICACPRLERTLAILKPEVVQFRDVVLRAIKSYGLDILNERKVRLSPEEASELYAKYYGRIQFPNMIISISYAPVVAFSLGGIDAVASWKNIIGPNGLLPSEWFLPDWIRREYGYISDFPDTLHGSGNSALAEKENRYFFPESIIDPVMKNSEEVKDYISKYVNPTLLKGLAILTKNRPIDPITFLAEWLLHNNPFQPRFPANVCLAPT